MKRILFLIAILLFCNYPRKEEAPKILKPLANETFSPFSEIEFLWEEKVGAVAYFFVLDDTNTFKTPVLETTLTTNSLILKELKEGSYYFKVRYLTADSVYSDWSETRRLVVKFLDLINNFKTAGYPNEILVFKNYIFSASSQVGLEVFNEQGKILNFSDKRNVLYGLALDTLRNFLYLAYGEKELSILNLKFLPDSLYEINSLSWPIAYAYDVSLLNDSLVVVAADKQFLVINVKDTSFLYTIAQIYFPSSLRGVFTNKDFIYLACEQEGVGIYQLADSIIFLANIDTPNNARDLVGNDTLLFVADGRGISVIDIKDKENPLFKKEIPISGYCKKLYLADSLLFAAAGDGGLKIYKITNDEEYLKLISEKKFSDCRAVFFAKPYLYVATRDEGILIYRLSY
jgi:hypothetical protein